MTAAQDEWRYKAACRDHYNPTIFLYSSLGRPRKGEGSQDLAKQVCEGCPVQQECLIAGGSKGPGTWGKMTEQERRSYFSKLSKERKSA